MSFARRHMLLIRSAAQESGGSMVLALPSERFLQFRACSSVGPAGKRGRERAEETAKRVRAQRAEETAKRARAQRAACYSSVTEGRATMGSPLPPVKKLRAVLFDVDGTLVDSDPIHFKAFQDTLLEIGFQGGVPIDHDFYDKYITGKHNSDIGAALFPDWDEAKKDKFLDGKEVYFRRLAAESLKPVEGLDRLRKWVEEHGLFRAAVTNAPRENAKQMIAAAGLSDFFQLVVIGDDCEHVKPFPDPYLKALNHFGVSADEAFALEDSPSGLKAAVAAGLAVVGLTTGNPESVLLDAGASLIIKNFNDPALWKALEEVVPT